jgi:copper oxidase (laccase) domain-containing protein
MLETSDRAQGLELIPAHADLQVVESNRLNGNINPCFSDLDSVLVSRMKLIAAAGCDYMVAMMPQGKDGVKDLDGDLITVPKEAYSKWPATLQPAEDVVYDPANPLHMIDIPADGLITTRPNNGLMLAAADCAPSLIYDQRQQILALAHNGREGTILDIGPKVVSRMRRTYGTKPADLIVHFGASVAPESYVLSYLSEPLRQEAWRPFLREVGGGYETDIVGYAVQRLLENGVAGQNISRSPVDVGSDQNYFSLTAHKRGDMPEGRNGFIAMMKPTE